MSPQIVDVYETAGDPGSVNGEPRAAIHTPAMVVQTTPAAPLSTEAADGFFRLREWQVRCSNELSTSLNWIINAPMAAGKSFQISAMAADRLRRDDRLKVIIAVPQTVIAAGFRLNKIEYPDGSRVEWAIQPELDLCSESAFQSTKHMLKFLNAPCNQNHIMDRVVLCTHATLVRAFEKSRASFKDVLIVIDEAHHVMHGGDEELAGRLENRLGALVRHSLQIETVQLGLTTATFFRGDNARIIPASAQFKRFGFAYDEYLASCEYLRSVSYDFVLYGTSFVDPLARLFETRIGKTIVYIPPVNSSSSLGSKGEDVKAVLRAISGIEEPVLADTDLPVTRVKRGDQWIRFVNLVDETNRAQKIAAIIAAHEATDSNNIDVVIALGMFKEGANWRWADREVIIGPRSSLTEIVQMIGRLFRDVAGKSRVEVYQMLPFALDQTDKERTRESLNGYLKAILLSLLLENVIDPALSPAEQDHGSRGAGGRRINYLNEACSDDGEAAIVLDEIKTRVLDATANDCSAAGRNLLREVFRDIVADVLGARGIWEHHDEIAEQILRMLDRRTGALAGLNVGHVDVDLIKENPLGCLLQYASEACGIKTFRDLRVASRARVFMPFDRARAFVRSLQLKSAAEWQDYCESGEKPEDIPRNPHATYELEGWLGYGDWLGTGRTRDFRPFPEARLFVRSLGLKSVAQWREYCASGQKPPDIPSAPNVAYQHEGWVGFPDWLGAGHARTHLAFQEARRFVHALALKSICEWNRYCKLGDKPAGIPSRPEQVYKDEGWSGYGDWLGTGEMNVRKIVWRPFEEARDFVRGLNLKSQTEWARYCRSGKKPSDIPTNPNVVYREAGWNRYRDWLGFKKTVRARTALRSFCDAREYVRRLELKSYAAWCEYCKSGNKPKDIPSSPAKMYHDQGWISWGDWLGTGTVGPRNHVFRSFVEARHYVHELGLASVSEWREFCKSGRKPSDIPYAPDQVYRCAGWAGFGDWLRGGAEHACAAA